MVFMPALRSFFAHCSRLFGNIPVPWISIDLAWCWPFGPNTGFNFNFVERKTNRIPKCGTPFPWYPLIIVLFKPFGEPHFETQVVIVAHFADFNLLLDGIKGGQGRHPRGLAMEVCSWENHRCQISGRVSMQHHAATKIEHVRLFFVSSPFQC